MVVLGVAIGYRDPTIQFNTLVWSLPFLSWGVLIETSYARRALDDVHMQKLWRAAWTHKHGRRTRWWWAVVKLMVTISNAQQGREADARTSRGLRAPSRFVWVAPTGFMLRPS